MIELYDIVDAIDKVTENKNLMLNRSMTPHHRFPAYKCFNYTVYDVKSSKEKVPLLEHSIKINTSGQDLLECWKDADRKFLNVLMKWIARSL